MWGFFRFDHFFILLAFVFSQFAGGELLDEVGLVDDGLAADLREPDPALPHQGVDRDEAGLHQVGSFLPGAVRGEWLFLNLADAALDTLLHFRQGGGSPEFFQQRAGEGVEVFLIPKVEVGRHG